MGLPVMEQDVQPIIDQILGHLNFSSGSHDAKFLANLNCLFGYFACQAQCGSPNSDRVQSLAASNDHLVAQQVGKVLANLVDGSSSHSLVFTFKRCT